MEDADDATDGDGEDGGDDGDGGGGDPPTWADLFARAAAHEVDESAVREALARRRESR